MYIQLYTQENRIFDQKLSCIFHIHSDYHCCIFSNPIILMQKKIYLTFYYESTNFEQHGL